MKDIFNTKLSLDYKIHWLFNLDRYGITKEVTMTENQYPVFIDRGEVTSCFKDVPNFSGKDVSDIIIIDDYTAEVTLKEGIILQLNIIHPTEFDSDRDGKTVTEWLTEEYERLSDKQHIRVNVTKIKRNPENGKLECPGINLDRLVFTPEEYELKDGRWTYCLDKFEFCKLPFADYCDLD